MSIIRNQAGQGIHIRAIDADGNPITEGVTAEISKDDGDFATSANPPVHKKSGVWRLPFSQAETNAASMAVLPIADGIIPDPIIIVTQDATISSRSTLTQAQSKTAAIEALTSYSPAKAGDAMSLTPEEREAIATALDIPTAADFWDEIFAELETIPTATPKAREALMLLYMRLRNQQTDTATTSDIRNDVGDVIGQSTLVPGTETFVKGKFQ